MRPSFVLALCLALAACAAPIPARDNRWAVLADCAGAYQANVTLSDPTRSAQMKAMVSEDADLYRKAAEDRYVLEPNTTAEQAKRAVAARMAAKAAALGNSSPDDVVKVIDACPQVDERP